MSLTHSDPLVVIALAAELQEHLAGHIADWIEEQTAGAPELDACAIAAVLHACAALTGRLAAEAGVSPDIAASACRDAHATQLQVLAEHPGDALIRSRSDA